MVNAIVLRRTWGTRQSTGGVDAFDSEAQAHGFEDGGETAKRGVSFFGQSAVELSCWRGWLFSATLLTPPKAGDLPESDEEFALLAVFVMLLSSSRA